MSLGYRSIAIIALAALGASVCASVVACGGASSVAHSVTAAGGTSVKGTQVRLTRRRGYVVGDSDADDLNPSGKDLDDRYVRDYGHEASAAQRRAVEPVVRRYFAVAASGRFRQACAMIYDGLAGRHDFTSVVPVEYQGAGDSALFRHRTCVEVEQVLFSLNHERLVNSLATLAIVGLRVRGSHGRALLGFKTAPEREIPVVRVGGSWKVDSLIDQEIV